jgi:DNA-binding MarR family transcriptional regulator
MSQSGSKAGKGLPKQPDGQPSPTGRQPEDGASEQQKIRSIVAAIDQGNSSTIARVMSGGGSSSGAGSRSAVRAQRILEAVENKPGCSVHDLARQMGEKSIFVVSHVDELVREKLLVRFADGSLYRSRDYVSDEEKQQRGYSDEENRQAAARAERAKIYIRVFRFLSDEMGVEPRCASQLTVHLNGGKFFEMKPVAGRVHMSLYGMYPRELVECFRQKSGLERKQINFSHLTGIIDIRGCRYQDLDRILPWLEEFRKSAIEQ